MTVTLFSNLNSDRCKSFEFKKNIQKFLFNPYQHDLKMWGSRTENLVQNNMLSADRSTVLIKSDVQHHYY